MSRSRKRHPVCTAACNKKLKRVANKKVRQYNKKLSQMESSDRYYIGNGKAYIKVFESYDICDYKSMCTFKGYYHYEKIRYVHCWWYNPKNELSDEEIYLKWYKYYKMK